MNTLSGRYFVAPHEEMENCVGICNADKSELTLQTAQTMAQRFSDDDGEPFCVVQVVRVVNPQRERAGE